MILDRYPSSPSWKSKMGTEIPRVKLFKNATNLLSSLPWSRHCSLNLESSIRDDMMGISEFTEFLCNIFTQKVQPFEWKDSVILMGNQQQVNVSAAKLTQPVSAPEDGRLISPPNLFHVAFIKKHICPLKIRFAKSIK